MHPERPLALIAALLMATPAAAQDASYGPVDERQASPAQAAILDMESRSPQPRERPSECDEADPDPDTIVVCRQWESGEQYRLGQRERRMLGRDVTETAGGAPRAPDFDESCLHNRGRENCMMGGSVPPPAIMVDFTSLPETPAESEAARLYGGPTADDALEAEGATP